MSLFAEYFNRRFFLAEWLVVRSVPTASDQNQIAAASCKYRAFRWEMLIATSYYNLLHRSFEPSSYFDRKPLSMKETETVQNGVCYSCNNLQHYLPDVSYESSDLYPYEVIYFHLSIWSCRHWLATIAYTLYNFHSWNFQQLACNHRFHFLVIGIVHPWKISILNLSAYRTLPH